ncbi:uncharacterized protein LOC143905723 [Temnothorax americanus]|uniref:uncharacterized protein LOC143905723 n=1 Tax=Temnothorax americanus TaxID=1964332 RepID=UPI004068F496
MENDDEFLILVIHWINLCLLLIRKKRQIRWLNRRWLVSPINMRRIQLGDYNNLFQEIKNDPQLFYRYTRMTLVHFQQLVQMTKPYLTKKKSSCLVPELRLLITLRYLATGDLPITIALAFRVGESTKKTGENMHMDIGIDGTFQIVSDLLMASMSDYVVLQDLEAYILTIRNFIVSYYWQ